MVFREKSIKASFSFPCGFTEAWRCMCEQGSCLVQQNDCLANGAIKWRRLKLLSRDCDGCSQMKPCSQRYYIVAKGDKVYCPDGTAHLVDGL